MQLGVGALARQNWSANACASADYGEADVIVSAKASGAQHTARVGRKSVLACGLPSVLQSLAPQKRHPSRRSVCTRLPEEAHSEALEWRGAPPRMARQAAARTRPPNSVAARVSCGVGGLQPRQAARDARRRRGADTTKRTTTIGRYSSARPSARTSKEPSGSRPQNQRPPGPLVDHRPSTLRRAP